MLRPEDSIGGSKHWLGELIHGFPVRASQGSLVIPVSNVVEDSRLAIPDSAYVFRSDAPLEYAVNAARAGATAIITERPLDVDSNLTQVRMSNLLSLRNAIASRFYDDPQSELDLIGIIGSKQRGIVSTLAHYVLDHPAHPTGLINHQWQDFGRFALRSQVTTPEPCELFRTLHRMVVSDRHKVVLEISTNALLEKRIQALGMHVLAFTDHVYDPTFRDVWSEVLELKRNALLLGWDVGAPDVVIINRDEMQPRDMLPRLGDNTLTYGLSNEAHIHATNYRKRKDGWRFTLCWKGGYVDDLLYANQSKDPKCIDEALGALAIAYACGRNLTCAAYTLSEWRPHGSNQLRLKLGT